MTDAANRIAFQGEPGAYSHLACREAYPDLDALAYPTFEEAFGAVRDGRAKLAMIPIENSVFGRVADIHHLLPDSGLYVIGEHFQPIAIKLLGIKGARLEDIKVARSHVHAVGQCRNALSELGIRAEITADTAGSARELAENSDPASASLASSLAAEIYGLDILREAMEDAAHNTTRFIVMSGEPDDADPGEGPCITSFIFKVKNVPAALYKGMGGFATNGVNMTKLESYQLEGSFSASQFYADIEGHPQDEPVRRSLEELDFFSREVQILGVYKAHPYRKNWEYRNGG